MSDPGWAALDAELSAWRAGGRVATFWWRDDDAVSISAPLQQLLALAEKFSVPLTLAVVPSRAEAALARALGAYHAISPIVHGYAHLNHAPLTQKPAEFGAHRPLDTMLEELRSGIGRLRQIFGEQLFPVLVPPWNRIAQHLIPYLPELGFQGISTFRPAANRIPAPGLIQTNCHIDAINWREGQAQRAPDAVLQELTALLRIRRLYPDISRGERLFGNPVPSGFDPEEPTGILTHHLVQSPESWQFLMQLLSIIQPHCVSGGAQWLTCAQAFELKK